MFGTIVIVLPSRFTGGSLHLSHSGQTKSIDISPYSPSATSVLAWYTDVYHSVHPILSGYRLALSYNLIHPPNSTIPKPILPQMGPVVERLKHVLLSWRQTSDDLEFEKLVYIFEHQYSQNNLKADALKGRDAHVMGLLQPIGEQLGFQMYLANIELIVHGTPDDDGCGYGRERYGGYGRERYGGYGRGRYGDCWDEDDDDDDEADPEDMTMQEVTKSELTVGYTVDLDGIPVKIPSINIDQETEVINGEIDDGDPDKREYESNMGNVSLFSQISLSVAYKN